MLHNAAFTFVSESEIHSLHPSMGFGFVCRKTTQQNVAAESLEFDVFGRLFPVVIAL